ncbi:MAG: repeat protein [Pedosphaera sp.]|nr:repeat protein [Pedosphaera sp.]
MVASMFQNIMSLGGLISLPAFGLFFLFQLWMCIDAVRRGEWLWAVFIWFFPMINAVLYYFMVYRASSSATRGFELPGAGNRKRIKELQAQIHHLDKAHHYFQLGDVYFRQGKLDKAEAAYRASLERDPQDIDARAHFGQCLLRLKKPAEARPFLEGVCAENPKHDYGYSMMALAETLTALNEPKAAIAAWLQVTANNQYPRAKVQLAELYLAGNQPDLARAELKDVLADDAHAPAYQRKRDRVWVRRARSLSSKLK